MVNNNYHTVFFQPIGYNNHIVTSLESNNEQFIPYRSPLNKINEYFLQGLYYIQYIVKALISSSPFIEEYGPVIRELPKMYHIVKAFKEIQSGELEEGVEFVDDESIYIEENTFGIDDPLPRLFI